MQRKIQLINYKTSAWQYSVLSKNSSTTPICVQKNKVIENFYAFKHFKKRNANIFIEVLDMIR